MTETVTTDITPEQRLVDLLFWAEAEHVKAEADLPNEWEQSSWFSIRPDKRAELYQEFGYIEDAPVDKITEAWDCGTACCLAGRAALSAGAVVSLSFNNDAYASKVITTEGKRVFAREYARDLLDLDEDQAERLFHAGNEIETVRDLVREFLTERGFTYTVDGNAVRL